VTALDTKILPKVVTLLNKYGKDIDFIVPASQTHNPDTGKVTTVPGTTYTVKGSPPDRYDSRLIDGAAIKADDSRTIIAAQGIQFTPELSMRVEFDSYTWAIAHVMPIYSGESIAAYEIRLRR
jgi:hypothetical protein